jgi:hypothetical protein
MDWRRLYPVFDAGVLPWILRSQFYARWPHTGSGKCAPRGTWPKGKDLYLEKQIITTGFLSFGSGSGFDCLSGSGSGKPIANNNVFKGGLENSPEAWQFFVQVYVDISQILNAIHVFQTKVQRPLQQYKRIQSDVLLFSTVYTKL